MVKMKLAFAAASVVAGLTFGGALEAQAAPVTMPDGSVFDPDYYAQMNPDVVITVGNDPAALYAHYVQYGQKEGRAAAAPADIISVMDPTAFDATYYAAKYPDVAAAFGSDARILQWHYDYWGKAEGRFANIAAETQAVQAMAQAKAQEAAQAKVQQQSQTQIAVTNAYIHDIYDLVNEERKRDGRGKLTWSDGLEAAAATRAKEIASYLSHERPDGSKYYTVIADANPNKLTEVYGQGPTTPQDMMEVWMKDNGFRTCLMNDKSVKIGVGYYCVNGATYWIALLWQNS